MRATTDIECFPFCAGGENAIPFISPIQQSLAETRRSFPELIGPQRHGIDGFLRHAAIQREFPARRVEVLLKLAAE
jgi:hypothetical protein